MDPALEGAPNDRMVSLRPYPPDELESMWADSRARYARDLLDNGGLPAEQAHAKAERDGEWLSGLDTLVFEIEHEGARIGRVVLWLDAFASTRGRRGCSRSCSTRRCAAVASAARRYASPRRRRGRAGWSGSR